MNSDTSIGTARSLLWQEGAVRLDAFHPTQSPGPGEMIVRPTQTAVTAIDLAVTAGLIPHDGVLGHEFVGVIDAAGPDADASRVGERVVGEMISPCRTCSTCRSGLGWHCPERRILGIGGGGGCHAERLVVHQSDLQSVPDSVDDDHAVFAQTTAVAVAVARRIAARDGAFVTVLGDGPVGLILAQLLARTNTSVRVVGRYTEKLRHCAKWELKHRHVDDVGRRADQDVVVDCTDSAAGLSLATQLVRPRGTVIRPSLPGAHPELDVSAITTKEIELIGSLGGPVRDGLRVLDRREVDVLSLISRRASLDDGEAVMHYAAQPGMLRVIVGIGTE